MSVVMTNDIIYQGGLLVPMWDPKLTGGGKPRSGIIFINFRIFLTKTMKCCLLACWPWKLFGVFIILNQNKSNIHALYFGTAPWSGFFEGNIFLQLRYLWSYLSYFNPNCNINPVQDHLRWCHVTSMVINCIDWQTPWNRCYE